MYWHEVISQLAMIPVTGMWVAAVALFEGGESESEIHSVVALQSKVIHTYKSATKRSCAPHHSELTKTGWTFFQTQTIVDPVILSNGRLLAVSDLETGPGIVYKTFIEHQPNHNDVYAILAELKERRDKDQVVGSEPDPNLNTVDGIVTRLDKCEETSERHDLLLRILILKPRITLTELIDICLVAPATLMQLEVLLFTKLKIEHLHLVRSSEICVANGYMLGKLSDADQDTFVGDAKNMTPEEFAPVVEARKAELRDKALERARYKREPIARKSEPDTKPNSGLSFLALLENYRNNETDIGRARIIHSMMNLRPTDSFDSFCNDCALARITDKDIYRALELNRLSLAASEQFKEGNICLANACALAKLPEEEQQDWLEKCKIQPPAEVVPFIFVRVAELEQARLEAKKNSIDARKSS